jgi:2-hydroxycyclohexanecarboxyl-CoA dehydrogenase
MSLRDKVAVVTGGAKGIGRAIGLRLARDGARIAIWDLDEANGEQTARQIDDQGGRAIYSRCDISSRSDIVRSIAATREALGPVAILVNNAATWSFTPFMEVDDALWDRVIDVNMGGTFRCAQAVLPDMLAAGWGRIINISSSSAQMGVPLMAHYAASKGGVIGFTKALAIELASTGITVNNIPPGYVETDSLHETPVDFAATSANSPMKRPGQPEDIAGAVAYLASAEAGYVTGQTLSVNGRRYLA